MHADEFQNFVFINLSRCRQMEIKKILSPFGCRLAIVWVASEAPSTLWSTSKKKQILHLFVNYCKSLSLQLQN